MATAASSSSSCVTFIAESLILPTRNIRLFAPISLLIFCHTFIFFSVAAIHVHPLAAAIHDHPLGAAILIDIDEIKMNTDPADHGHAAATDSIRGRAKKLALVYLAYLVSKLAVQVVAVVAGSTTYSGERLCFTELLRWEAIKERISGPFITAIFMGVLDLTTATLLVLAAILVTSVGVPAMASIFGYLLFLVAVVFYIHLSAVIPVSIAVSAAAPEGRWAAPALWLAWRLMKARRKEAGVLTLVGCLVPATVWPVHAISDALSDSPFFSFYVWLLGIVFGFFLLPVALQLLSTAAATVFYYHCVEVHGFTRIPDKKACIDDDDAVVVHA